MILYYYNILLYRVIYYNNVILSINIIYLIYLFINIIC